MSLEQKTLERNLVVPEDQEQTETSFDRRRFLGAGIGRLAALVAGGAILFHSCKDDYDPDKNLPGQVPRPPSNQYRSPEATNL